MPRSRLFTRIEPLTGDGDLTESLAARVYDPAWMLARQWMMGEFLGDDGGTPVVADLRVAARTLDRLAPGKPPPAWPPVDEPDVFGLPIRTDGPPLDLMVESEPQWSAPQWPLRLRVDAGREFLEHLRALTGGAALAPAVLRHFPLPPPSADLAVADLDGERLLEVVAGRIPDGQALRAALAPLVEGDTTALPAELADRADDLRPVAKAWLDWCAAVLPDPARAAPAWDPRRLEYGFSVAAVTRDGTSVLRCTEHGADGLDWYSFDADSDRAGPPAAPPEQITQISALPTAVSFHGMPAPRWWEFEDATIDLGAVEAGTADLARLVVLEFALAYGNDFFAVPVSLPVGTVSRVARLTYTDTFGATLQIAPASSGGWTMFTLASATTPDEPVTGLTELLVLPPVAAHDLHGPAIEAVNLLRDEMANLAWAIEQGWEGGTGQMVQRDTELTRQREPQAAAAADAGLRWTLATEPPLNWVPLLPVDDPQGLLLRSPPGGDRLLRGRILPSMALELPDAEVPREGISLTRNYAFARGADGTPYLWSRRRRTVGRGEGASGLQYDSF